jgi:hypothetical protein
MQFKLPEEFMAAHGDAVRAWNWREESTVPLGVIVPETSGHVVFLECIKGVVRPKSIGSAHRLRRYSETLPQCPRPTAEETAAVIAHKNRNRVPE